MSANDLALKYSNAPAIERIGKLPHEEVIETLKEEVEDEVCGELYQEHEIELQALEQQLDEATDEAREFEEIVEDFATAIKLAITLPWAQALPHLEKVLNDNPGYGREPPAAS